MSRLPENIDLVDESMLPEDRPSPVKLMVNAEARPEGEETVLSGEHRVETWAPREGEDQRTIHPAAGASPAALPKQFLNAIQLPSFEQVVNDSKLYAQAS